MVLDNKWLRGAIPALLIHCSIGTVYCWSQLKDEIAAALNCANSDIEWAFSLAIFFLGMSAAFGGNFVERNVKHSATLSAVCFGLGMIGTSASITLGSITGVLLCYGCLMGIGLGIGYLTPVKTLMMWFSEHKGLATGIAITGFGLAKVIASPIIEFMLKYVSISELFFYLGIAYTIIMSIGSLLIKKPNGCSAIKGDKINFKNAFKIILNKQYLAIWFVFFINITCGLALISQEKTILSYIGLAGSLAIIASLTAAFNSIGRFGYSTLSDKVKDRGSIYVIIFLSSALLCTFVSVFAFNNVQIILGMLVIGCLIGCNAGYGGGFSTLPSLLSDKFGMKNVSVIHGFALSAWAWAGLVGNHLGNYLLSNHGIAGLFLILSALYLIAYWITHVFIWKQT
jgi:OFA family oxalate/formate antiporter-like MFS transporter